MQHVEFLDTEHFEKNYHRVKPHASLDHFIDFFWQTKFEHLWDRYPKGFSDALFPNIGYTYLLNLGTPFVMQVDDQKFKMKTDGFLPRHRSIECHHQVGNVLFGIKFRISPIMFEKKVNFAEYKNAIFPLSYLIEKKVVQQIKSAGDFAERTAILNDYFLSITQRSGNSLHAINIVMDILNSCNAGNNYTISIQDAAARHGISTRTLQRYFENTTSLSSKHTLQILRVRKAVEHIVKDPATFDHKLYGYYDYSHFYKHLGKFMKKASMKRLLSAVKTSRQAT